MDIILKNKEFFLTEKDILRFGVFKKAFEYLGISSLLLKGLIRAYILTKKLVFEFIMFTRKSTTCFVAFLLSLTS